MIGFRVIKKDCFFVTQPYMVVFVEPGKTDRSRQVAKVLYRQFVDKFETVVHLVVSEYLTFLADFPQDSILVDVQPVEV